MTSKDRYFVMQLKLSDSFSNHCSNKKYKLSPRTCRRKSKEDERIGKKIVCIYQKLGIDMFLFHPSALSCKSSVRASSASRSSCSRRARAFSSSKRCSSRAARSLSSSRLPCHVLFTTGAGAGAVAMAARGGDGFGFAFAFRSGPCGRETPGGRGRGV